MTQTRPATSTILPPCDVLIVAAIQEEYEAIQAVETGAVPGSVWREHKDAQGLPVRYRAFLNHDQKELVVALIRGVEPGGSSAATALAGLPEILRPQCLAMCGVCAGHIENTNLGDVIIAERVFLHDSGKLKPGAFERDVKTFNLDGPWLLKAEEFRNNLGDAQDWLKKMLPLTAWSEEQQKNWLLDMLSRDIDPRNHDKMIRECCPSYSSIMRQLVAENLVEKGTVSLSENGKNHIGQERIFDLGWPSLKPPRLGFEVHVAPFAAGNHVVADATIWKDFRSYERKTLAVEMESEAIGKVAARHGLPFFVMKGVMDHADVKKTDVFKPFAARASAECLLSFLRKHLDPRGTDPFPEDSLVPGTLPLPSTDPKPSNLLTAGYQTVPFQGREEFLNDLEAWRMDKDPVRIRLIHGAGGMGKTRLMIEWTKKVRESDPNWMAGFLREPVREGWFARLSSLGKPMLIAIDYAERWSGLHKILEPLVKHSQSGRGLPVRVVLLARNAEVWWSELQKKDALLRDLLGRDSSTKLAPLAIHPEQREEVFSAAKSVFELILNKPPSQSPTISLEKNIFESVLFLHMAALIAVEGWPVSKKSQIILEQLPTDGEHLIEAVLDHEQRYWRPSIDVGGRETLWENAVQEMISAATLLNGLEQKNCRSIRERLLQGREMAHYGESLENHVHRLYPGKEEDKNLYITPLQPDLLGEAMVRRTLKQCDDFNIYLTKIFEEQDSESIIHGMEVLGALSVQNAQEHKQYIKTVLRQDLQGRSVLALRAAKQLGTRTAFGLLGDGLLEELEQVSLEVGEYVARDLETERFPHYTVSLLKLSVWTARAAVDCSRRGDRTSPTYSFNLATNLYKLSRRMGIMEQRKEALESAQEAVTLIRKIAKKNPGEFLPDLSMALNNLAAQLYRMGQTKKALKSAQQTVVLIRSLTKKNPEDFLPDLADSLNTMTILLSELKQDQKALSSAQEAVKLMRKLAKEKPDIFLPQLAYNIGNLANQLSKMGQKQKALNSAQEASILIRELAKKNPDAFLPDLASHLNNMAIFLGRLGQPQEALKSVQEAVRLTQQLAKKNPEAFLPDLAFSHNNFAIFLNESGDIPEALDQVEEAVKIRRELAKDNPDAFLPSLSTSLNILADIVAKVGNIKKASSLSIEALNLIWPYYRLLPSVYGLKVGAMLQTSLKLFNKLGQEPSVEWNEWNEVFQKTTKLPTLSSPISNPISLTKSPHQPLFFRQFFDSGNNIELRNQPTRYASQESSAPPLRPNLRILRGSRATSLTKPSSTREDPSIGDGGMKKTLTRGPDV